MRRTLCLATLAAAGILAAVAANEARQERFRIRPLRIAENLYVLTSDPAQQGMRSGGNTAVFVTASGVALVDTKIRGYGGDILAEVRRITDRPVTTIINTHTHLRRAIDTLGGDVDTIIPGHADYPLAWDDLVDYAGFYGDLLAHAQEGAAAGRSVAETVAAYSVPDEYGDFQAPANRVESIVRLVYEGR